MWGKLYGQFIIAGKYEYSYVISRRPDLKNDIDLYLVEVNHDQLITN